MSQASKDIAALVRTGTLTLQARLAEAEESLELYRWKVTMARRSRNDAAGKFADLLETVCIPDLEAKESRLRAELEQYIGAGRDAMQEVAELEAEGLVS